MQFTLEGFDLELASKFVLQPSQIVPQLNCGMNGAKASWSSFPERPRGTQIYLHYGAEVTVRVTLPLPDRAPIQELLNRCFDPSGLLVGSPLQTLPPLLAVIESLPARERLLICVAEAVREYLALLQDREEVQQQKEWFLDQVEREDAAIGVFITLEPPTRDMTQEAIACSPDSSTVGRTRVSYPQSIYP